MPDGKNTSKKARKKLLLESELQMEMKQNEEVASETHIVFNFMVSSPGGTTLHGLQQCINCCGLKCNEVPARSMSPPGPIFHLSVYSTARSSEAAN